MHGTSEKALWPIWQVIRLVFLGPGFNPHQSFVQCLIFLTNLTNVLSRNLGKENSKVPFERAWQVVHHVFTERIKRFRPLMEDKDKSVLISNVKFSFLRAC